MVERFLQQTAFRSQEDYRKNLHIRVPENFNFAYDVVDAYAEEQPDRKALLWTNDQGAEIQFTFADMKRETDRTASYFQRLGIGKGDVVMLILKRRYEFWFSILALHKLGAVVIPATHLLTKKDVVYRCNTAGIKAIVAAGERVITDHVAAAMPESPTTELLISVGPEIPEGFLDFHAGIANAAPFVRPQRVNANDDIMMMYFTSGTTGGPKMVAHAFAYFHNVILRLSGAVGNADTAGKIDKANMCTCFFLQFYCQFKQLLCQYRIILICYCVAGKKCMNTKVLNTLFLQNTESFK